MDIFNVLTLIGGLSLFLFGMNIMGQSLERRAGGKLRSLLGKLTTNKAAGLLTGLGITAIIQSSSASVGILQALASTGQVSYGAAIPIIMGQNIGTCVTTMISSVGANKNAKRAAMVHLSFNIIGTAVWLNVFCLLIAILTPVIFSESASLFGIAVAHSIFNVLCTILMLPLSGLLEKLVTRLVPDAQKPETQKELDDRLLTTPPIALKRCREVAADMAETAVSALKERLIFRESL